MGENLSGSQLEDLIQRLKEMQVELEIAIKGSAEKVAPVDLDEPIGRISRMDAIQDQQIAKAGRAALQLKAKQVAASLKDHERGHYGDCRRCKESIGWARLNARPESPFCLPCQEALEERQG